MLLTLAYLLLMGFAGLQFNLFILGVAGFLDFIFLLMVAAMLGLGGSESAPGPEDL